MKKIKVSEATPIQLDWLVAKCDGRNIIYDTIAYWVSDNQGTAPIGAQWKTAGKRCGYSPSTDWAQGGPIIDKHISRIEEFDEYWEADCAGVSSRGETALIAAMRAYVSKLGDEVEVPEEL